MYNPDLKELFAKSYSSGLASERAVMSFFRASEPFEGEYGKDLCMFEETELQSLFDSFSALRKSGVLWRRTAYRSYVEFMKAYIPESIDVSGSLNLTFTGFEDKLVGSPEHLQIELDRRFPPGDGNDADNIFRASYWIAFSGVREEDAAEIRNENIDLHNMEIVYSGRAYPIYDQAVQCIRNCMEMEQIYVQREANGVFSSLVVQRASGDQILRYTKHPPMSRPWVAQLCFREKKLRASGKITAENLQYLYVWKSGIFYRMYQRELAGIPVDFADAVDLYIDGRDYDLSSLHGRIGYRKQRLNKQFIEEYATWKIQFAL